MGTAILGGRMEKKGFGTVGAQLRKGVAMIKEKYPLAMEGYGKVCAALNHKWSVWIAIGISALLFELGRTFYSYNLLLAGVALFWLYSVLYCLAGIQKRFFLMMMYLVQFTFLLSRPIISFFRGDEWWYFSRMTVIRAMLLIYVSMLFMLLSEKLLPLFKKYYKKLRNLKAKPRIKWVNKAVDSLRKWKIYPVTKWCLLVGLIIATLIRGYMEVSTYLQMKDLPYEMIYTAVAPQFPLVVRVFGKLFDYAVIAYLALMPKKKTSYAILMVYIIMAVPSLLLGTRFPFVLRILFAVVYAVIRETAVPKGEKWISKRFVSIIVIVVILLVLFMGVYNYIREGAEVPDQSLLAVIVDFFYKQGTTFDAVCQGLEYENEIRNLSTRPFYTLGDIIDYIRYSSIGQVIFGTDGLSSGNSLEAVYESNSLAHRLSYVVLGEEGYLSGHGRGSSYLLEVYFDGGYLLLSVYSILLGAFLLSLPLLIKKGSFVKNYIILNVLVSIFSLPRSSASSFICDIVTVQYWIIPLCMVLLYYITKNMWDKGNVDSEQLADEIGD